jgi:hypothetical protein
MLRLVDDQRVVGGQVGVVADLGQGDAVGHQLHGRGLTEALGEAHLIADGPTDLAADLLGDARGDGRRRDASWLGVADHALETAAKLQAQLRQLGRLARARIAADDDHLERGYGLA